jgi:SsrA-binding protein
MKEKGTNPSVVLNRKARYDYNLGEELTVGMVLTGREVRQIRDARAQLRGSYVTLRAGELWLLGLTLGSETAVSIKLLATKKQILSLTQKKQSEGITLVPTKLLPLKRHIKLVISVAKGKKKYDKRETIKKRDLSRYEKTN